MLDVFLSNNPNQIRQLGLFHIEEGTEDQQKQ